MAGVLNTVYSLAVLVVALLGMVYVLGLAGEGERKQSWWAWGVVIVVAVFLLAQVGMLLMT